MNIEVTRINEGVCGDPDKFVELTNEAYVYQLKKIAEDIVEKNRKYLLFSFRGRPVPARPPLRL